MPIAPKPSSRPQSQRCAMRGPRDRVYRWMCCRRSSLQAYQGCPTHDFARTSAVAIARVDLAGRRATERAGIALASALGPGMIVTLSGDLGTGKTTLARGVLRGLGWTGPVKSPSYTWLNIIRFRTYTCITLISIGSTTPSEWDDAGVAEAFRPDSGLPGRMAGAGCANACPRRTSRLCWHAGRRCRTAGDCAAVATTRAGERCLSRARHGPARVTRVSIERRRALKWLVVPAAALVIPRAFAAPSVASTRVWPAQEYTRVILEGRRSRSRTS